MEKVIPPKTNDRFPWLRSGWQWWQTLRSFVVSPLRWFWRSIPAYLPFYLLILAAGYAGIRGWHRQTAISAFRLPPDSSGSHMPFGGETVANLLEDALTAIRQEAEGRPPAPPCDVLGSTDEDFAGLTARASTSFAVDSDVGVEVNGISVAAAVEEARQVLGRETRISGDVLLDGPDKFQLVARAKTAAAWVVTPQPLTLAGLKRASCEMAERIWASTDENLLAAALIYRGDYQRVINLYRQMPTDQAHLADALNNLGVALRKTGQVDDAIAKFNQALQLRPRFPETHYNLGIAADAKGDRAEAMAQYREALRLRPNFAEALNNLGVDLHAQGDKDGAIAQFREALRLKPQFPGALTNLGNALVAKGDNDAAIADFQAALQLANLPQSHNGLGEALAVKGDNDAAISEFRKALQLDNADGLAHYNLSLALDRKGQHREAVAECKKARALQYKGGACAES